MTFDSAAGVDFTQGKLYIAMLKEEFDRCSGRLDQHDQQFSSMEARVKSLEDQMLELVLQGSIKQSEIPKEAKERNREEWDEWLKVKDFLKKVDTDKHQYILIADRMSSALMQDGNLGVLGRVRWKVVFDLDPDSDIDGLLKFCSPEESNGGIVVPVSIANQNSISNFDAKRMHWVFANGKNQASVGEVPKQTFIEWKSAFKTPIQDIVRICCENLDSRKSTFCIMLPVTPGVSKNVANFIAKQIYERFSYAKYDMRFVAFEPEMNLEKVGGERNAIHSSLSLKYILIGLHSLLGESQVSYQVPCHVKGMKAEIPIRQFQFISEYFDILYSGCENIPKELSPEEEQEFENEHLRSFLRGNPITFESLSYGHDARRSLTIKIIRYITSMPQRFTSSQIVQISHAPGTGCTTIARRVLWDLREEFPCMIIKELFAGESTLDSDLEPYVLKLWERIIDLEKLCELSPLVLIDGSSRMVKLVSDQLVRRLAASGKRAIILRCVNYEGYCEIDQKLFHKESTFEVKSVLEDDTQDITAFRTYFFEYCSRFGDEQSIDNLKKDLQTRTRVFHFPMAVMLGECTKWKKNVLDSLELLKESYHHQYEVAILVAFIQIFASWATPALLLEKYFERTHETYSEKANGYSEYLLNLMVSEKARNKNKFIGQKSKHPKFHDVDDEENFEEDEDDSRSIEAYSFQHCAVAELVWEYSKRKLDEITEDFVKSPLLRDYKKNKDLQRLIDDLFLYNTVYKKDPDPEPEAENQSSNQSDDFKLTLPITEHRFSLLMTNLAKFHNSQRIFEDVAKSINDITYFSHAARFYVYGTGKKPNFQKANELLRAGLEVGKNGPVKKIRDVRNTEGYIGLKEMRTSKEISSIDDLKSFADKVLTLFHRAKDNPPRQFQNPLLGIVSVWLFCLERIIKLKNGNVEEALATVLQDSFFSIAIGESFELLDEVEIIVQDNPKLIDPDYTMQLCNDKKLDLMRIIGRKRVKRNRKTFDDIDVPALCDEISTKYFPGRSNKEILRLRAMWMIKQAKSISRVSEKSKLFDILKRLVLDYKMYEYARKLLDISAIMDEPGLDINECQGIIRNWQEKLPNDAFSYLYDYAMSFVCVANSDISDNRARFERSKKICIEKTKWSIVRNKHYYYMAKCKKTSQFGTLIPDQELTERYSRELQKADENGSEPSEDESEEETVYPLGPKFWKNYAGKLLHECSGRIQIDRQYTRKGHGSPYIALEQGNLHINIPPHTLGVPYKDYRPDSRVKFFICFCLSGPKALEIRLVENTDREGAKAAYGRQSSLKRNIKR